MTTKAPPSPRRKKRSAWRALWIVPLRAIGWLSWVVLALAFFIDQSELARTELERELGQRLEVTGSTIQIESVSFDWLGPGLTVEGLRIENDGREHLFVEHLYVAARISSDGPPSLERVDVDGGRVLISEAAIEEVRALMNAPLVDEEVELHSPLELPSVQVRDLEVDLEVPGSPVSSLGKVDLSMRAELDAPSKITGRVVLPSLSTESRATEIFLSGLVQMNGELEVHAVTDQLRIEAWDAPDFGITRTIRALSPRGSMSMHATGNLSLAGDLSQRGEIRLRLDDGAFLIPGVSAGVEAVELGVDCRFEPKDEEDLWSPRAWSGSARLAATCDEQELRAGLRLGEAARDGLAFEGWFQAPDLDVRTPSLTALEEPRLIPTLYSALEPYGRVDARFGITCGEDIRPDSELWPEIEFTVHVKGHDVVRAAYHGWRITNSPDERPIAYALPAQAKDARVVFAHTKRFPRHDLLDVRFAGQHPTGPFHGCYQQWSNPVDMPPFAPGYGREESDLFIVVPDIELNAELDSHLPELWEIPELGTLFNDYGLKSGGRASALVRVTSRADLPLPAVLVDVDASNVEAAYAVIPVPAKEVEARVVVIDNGRSASSVSFRAIGKIDSARSMSVSGRVRSEALPTDEDVRPTRCDWVDVRVHGIDVEGPDLDIAGQLLPDAREIVEELRPRGHFDMHYVRTSRRGEEVRTWIEASPHPGDFVVKPDAFPMRADDVRGRVLVDVWEAPYPTDGSPVDPLDEPRTLARVSPIVSRWRPGSPITFVGEFPTKGEMSGSVLGAGFVPADRELVDDLAFALEIDKDPRLADFEAIDVTGAIDFDYEFVIPEGSEEHEGELKILLRGNDLRERDGFELDDLQGTLVLRDDVLRSEWIETELGGAKLDLRNFKLTSHGEELHARADLSAVDVDLSERLLGKFLDSETVAQLVDEFDMRGTLDLDQGQLDVHIRPDQEPEITLRGEGTLSDAFIAIELPVSIRSARLQLKQLTLQGDELRGWGRIDDLYGEAVGRDLAQTQLLLSYHGTQLTIASLDGLFCRGRLHGLADETSGVMAPPVATIDLLPPYRFQVGLSIDDLDVGLLLDDVFTSEIADSGLLSGRVELSGELDDLFRVRGTGFGQVKQTVLWSVPVVRDLFGQLGFNETAIFDEMESSFRVQGGRILMDRMRVHSPLLNLRGSGALGFDGTLDHRLEITYSLVDKTGPLSAVIYWLQNNLLAIAIRGDMSRPKIIPLGLFSNPFVSEKDAWRALPAPGFSELPVRF